MADVAFNDVDKIYDNGVQAVFGLTLDIHDAEFLVLVGPSGCGKTTALRMVAGLEEISAGTLSIGGRVVNELSPKERDIAMVFQNYALYPHLSVAENIAFGLRLRKEAKAVINERVAWAAKLLDLAPYLDRKPKELSGGQRQRVAMGRAIVRKPQVFLMDEPLSNLDAKLRVQMRADIAHLQRELQTTTVYVTHDQVEAMTMGDRVAVMASGILQQVDAPQRLYDRPENLFVAGFIGTPPMNLLEATATVNGGVSVNLGGNVLPIAPEALEQYPRLREYDGRPVIVGLRAGDLHPAQGRDDLPQIHATVEIVESLGGESMAYFKVDARHIKSEAAEEEEILESETEETVVGSRPNLVASFPPHVQLKLRDEVPIAVDTKNLHFFDEASGAPLR
ncbi:MAG TPA: sn-glycerol-3-phosphate ABC transporter ATP-binding protein UgpC [Gaiellaceae bacterium]|jgi:multiple sugar transport system ATP-binding protein|nr:sn-glycerol-3-phosphate ABC transporter ATP-binding protein UgpC [Gaiellaceae bacterium]